ncbi:MAG TPA: cytochrome c-type biogenesis protein CcmH [Candidatus Binataceae bacterium]|nr:cytochrome c-type biogenesis protein CcmH [Candidatus Binataceae bacterium]
MSIARRFADAALVTALAALALTIVMAVSVVRSARAAVPGGQEIAEGLTCQCGCGLTVANCNHPNCSFSVPMRERIDTMLAHGMGRAEIIAYFRKQYGEKILSAPTTQGFNLLAWTMPFVALVVGGGLIVLMMERWRGGSPSAPQSPSDPGSGNSDKSGGSDKPGNFDPALRERLERELRERR